MMSLVSFMKMALKIIISFFFFVVVFFYKLQLFGKVNGFSLSTSTSMDIGQQQSNWPFFGGLECHKFEIKR